MAPYGAGVERIKVQGTKPFLINFTPQAGTKWKISIIYVYSDGTRERSLCTPYTVPSPLSHYAVNPANHPKKLTEVIVIKTLVGRSSPARINMTVIPIENASPGGAITLDPDLPYEWILPPYVLNFTEPADWPWELYWLWPWYDDTIQPTLEVNVTGGSDGALFNLTIEIDGRLVLAEPELVVGTSLRIPFDPAWLYSDIIIGLHQGTPTSMGHGTLRILLEPPSGGYGLPERGPVIDTGLPRACPAIASGHTGNPAADGRGTSRAPSTVERIDAGVPLVATTRPARCLLILAADGDRRPAALFQ